MTCTVVHRRTAGIVSLALALGVAAPAAARPFNLNQQGSIVSAGPAQTYSSNVPAATSHTTSGGISDWGYVAIGSGAASLALIGVGGTRVAGRRRQQPRATQGSTTTA
ncbi:MAG: hypothetical protein M3022_02940 [Actinomycetota bacterium]|nr:hypothetical protein [Actinomycetota bacterium]